MTGLIDQTRDDLGGGDAQLLTLETAAGQGIEVINIHETRGEAVQLLVNERDRFLRKAVRRKLRRRKVPLVKDRVTPYSWADMARELQAYRGQVGMVLCVGNSFPYLQSDEDRGQTLASFGELMAPGGVLVVDTRNYDEIIAWAAQVLGEGRSLSDAGKEFPFSGTPMFNGPVLGRPIHASLDRSVTFEYKDERNPPPKEGLNPSAYITYTPLSHRRMEGLLETNGFSPEIFYDFVPVDQLNADDRKRAGFIQYVCRKPKT